MILCQRRYCVGTETLEGEESSKNDQVVLTGDIRGAYGIISFLSRFPLKTNNAALETRAERTRDVII